jgi:PAS domain-containing protein
MRQDGTMFPVEVRARRFQHGAHQFRLSLARDISERKMAELSLRQREKELREILETIPVMTVTVLPDGSTASLASVRGRHADNRGHRLHPSRRCGFSAPWPARQRL